MNLDFFDFLLTFFGFTYTCPLLLTNILFIIKDVIEIVLGYKVAQPISPSNKVNQVHHTPENDIHIEESTVNTSQANLSTPNHTTIQARYNSKTPITPRTEMTSLAQEINASVKSAESNINPQMTKVSPEVEAKMFEAAFEVRDRAYCVYSKFNVGAALLTPEGEIVPGCNIENASYGHTICAERSAICKAVSEGKRQFVAVAIVTNADDFVSPCGACRQMLREFSDPKKMCVMLDDNKGGRFRQPLEYFLPMSFGPDHLLDSNKSSKY